MVEIIVALEPRMELSEKRPALVNQLYDGR